MRGKGLGVIFITHNVRHAYAVGDRFTVLNRGKTLGTYAKSEITIDELQNLMAGGKDLQALSARARRHGLTCIPARDAFPTLP